MFFEYNGVMCKPIRSRNAAARRGLIDHLVGQRQQCWWHADTKLLCGPSVDDQSELARLLDREVSRLLAAKDFRGIYPGAAKVVEQVGRIGHQKPRTSPFGIGANRWLPCR